MFSCFADSHVAFKQFKGADEQQVSPPPPPSEYGKYDCVNFYL